MIKKINDKLNELHNQINLKKHFPDYFVKPIFQGTIILMIIFTAFVFVSNGFKLRAVYIECNDSKPCDNPLYICPENNSIPAFWRDDCVIKENMPKQFIPLCEQGACSKEMLNPGEVYGNKPNFWFRNYNLICIIMALSAFIVNHTYYLLRKRKLKMGGSK